MKIKKLLSIAIISVITHSVYSQCNSSFTYTTYPAAQNQCDYLVFTNTSSFGPNTFFTWNFGDGYTINQPSSTTSISHNYNTPGVYTVTLSLWNSNTPCSTTTQTVNVNCICTASISAQLDASNYPGTCNTFVFGNLFPTFNPEYNLWSYGDGSAQVISTGGYSPYTYTTNGVYTVTLSVYSSSTSVTPFCTTTKTLSVNCSSVTSISKNSTENINLSVYPNPFQDELILSLNALSNNNSYMFIVTNSLGQTVIKDFIKDSKTFINTSGLTKGVYFVSILNKKNEKLQTNKIVK